MDFPVALFGAQPVGGRQDEHRMAAQTQRLHHRLAMS